MRRKLLQAAAYLSVAGGWGYLAVTSGQYLAITGLFLPLLVILLFVPKMERIERRRVSREIDSAGGLDNWRKLHLG